MDQPLTCVLPRCSICRLVFLIRIIVKYASVLRVKQAKGGFFDQLLISVLPRRSICELVFYEYYSQIYTSGLKVKDTLVQGRFLWTINICITKHSICELVFHIISIIVKYTSVLRVLYTDYCKGGGVGPTMNMCITKTLNF